MSRIVKIGAGRNQDVAVFEECQEIISGGGVIAYPTETFYGLGGSAFDERSIRKIFELKGRAEDKPLLVLIGERKQLSLLIEKPVFPFERLVDTFWPGPLTVIFKASPKLPLLLLGNKEKIGIRISGCETARSLPIRCGLPITSTSANISGQPVLCSAEEILKEWGDRIDLILDGGVLQKSRGSTIIDISDNRLVLIREGDIPFGEIEKAVR